MKPVIIGLSIAASTFLKFQLLDVRVAPSISNTIKFDKVIRQEEKPQLSFSSSVKYGKQTNQLSVLISTDFDGNYNLESVKKASWQSLNQLAKLASGEEFQNSDIINISQFVNKGRPFYVAFRYVGEASANGKPTQRTWQIKDIKLSEAVIANFNIVNSPGNGEKVGWSTTTQGLIFKPNATLMASESWAISGKLNLQ